MNLSKSKYTTAWQCPKALWMKKYMPEKLEIDDSVQERMAIGNEVGDLAMHLFGDFVEATEYNGDKIDLNRMVERTKEEMEKGTENICEASFLYNGLYCAVDILRKEEDGYSIYEVKSSTNDEKDIYSADVAYQKYVLEHCGIKVVNTYIVVLDNTYVKNGDIDISKLFRIANVNDRVEARMSEVESILKEAEVLLNDSNEPEKDIGEYCFKPYPCGFWKYCSRNLPTPNVFDLYRMAYKTALKFYHSGYSSFESLETHPEIKSEHQKIQIDYELHDRGVHIDKAIIRKFLDTCRYPLYFLDFETQQMAIPQYDGTRPYQQIAFQYSLHYIEEEGGELKHKEFLGVSGEDPRRALCEQLCKDIPLDSCTMVFNKAFECSRLKEMARDFPDMGEHLLNIRDNIIDLLIPFRDGGYYCKEMKGSFSIKSVLPALFPDDPELDYHSLDQIHHGGEAMAIFPKIKDMPLEEQKKTRHNLLEYCKLDTLAMVKVWQSLKDAVE